jgi:hypothetical protein
MNSGEPDAHHIDSLLSLSDGLEGMARLGGDEYAGANCSAVSNFFGVCRGECPIPTLGRSSSSPPISSIPSTERDFVLRCRLGGHSEAGVRHAQREEP